jgi:hypothetical protein
MGKLGTHAPIKAHAGVVIFPPVESNLKHAGLASTSVPRNDLEALALQLPCDGSGGPSLA